MTKSLIERLAKMNVVEIIDSLNLHLQMLTPDGKRNHKVRTIRQGIIVCESHLIRRGLSKLTFEQYEKIYPEKYKFVLARIAESIMDYKYIF